MKKITLLVAGILLIGNAANASATIDFYNESQFPIAISEAEPIVFEERGIAFYVFADGQFDFNTRPDDSEGDYYYRKAGKTVAKTGTRNHVATDYGVRIEHDNFGRVRRIGNVFINYDANDRIKRIGTVYMTYNRYALAQVGGMKIVYNRRGEIVDYIGVVKGRSYNSGYTYNNYYDDAYYGPSNGNNQNDYYYYRTDGTKAKIEERTPANRDTGKR